MKLEPRHARPLQLLRLAEEQYPGAIEALAEMRTHKGSSLPDWPQWCYLPLAAGIAVATKGAPVEQLGFRERLSGAAVGAPLTALSAWRVTKGVWDFDPDTLEALWSTPIEGRIPIALLYRLPEWCLYLCLPARAGVPVDVHGAFVHLEADANSGQHELRILLDRDGPASLADRLPSIPLHLDADTVDECLQRASDQAVRRFGAEQDFTSPGFAAQLAGIRVGFAAQTDLVLHILALVLYLCSQEPDLTRRAPPSPASYRKLSPKPAQQPTVWPVGLRIGAALRAAAMERTEAGDPTGRGVRAHMRRAHWHCYWTGSRSEGHPGDRLELRWVAPVAVGAGEAVAVVRPVK